MRVTNPIKMSRTYKVYDQTYPHFITSTVIHWIDLFTRNEYRDVVIESLQYCRTHKGLLVFAWCIMTNHIHLVVGTRQSRLEDIIRDFKSYTSRKLRGMMEAHPGEPRKAWMLQMMQTAGRANPATRDFQLWQHHYHPVHLDSGYLIDQKITYIHMNPVKAGFVDQAEDYPYSSARSFAGLPGLMEIDQGFDE